MNKSIFIYAIAALGILSFIAPQAQAIEEDQFYICAETYPNDKIQVKEVNCTIITADDFLNKTQREQLETQFNNNLDTFDASYLDQID